jgi:hypothetical protein
MRLEFWRQLVEHIQGRTSLHANIAPSKDNWISTGAGKSGVTFNYVILMNDARVELYIYTGKEEESKHIFDKLYTRKDEIERKFGSVLNWHRLDGKLASRVSYLIEGLGLEDQDNWAELHDRMIDAMIRLCKAFRPEISRL